MFTLPFLMLVTVYVLMMWIINKNVKVEPIKIITDADPVNPVDITSINSSLTQKRGHLQRAWIQHLNYPDHKNKTL